MYGVRIYQVCVCGTYFNKSTYKLAVSDDWAQVGDGWENACQAWLRVVYWQFALTIEVVVS